MRGEPGSGNAGERFGGLTAALLAAAFVLASCSPYQTDSPRGTVATAPLPPAVPRPENAQPRVPPQVARSFGGLYSDPAIERRLASILARLVPASERPDLRYSVAILNSPTVNAFALPDGQLFVTRGLLALANDEAEVAAVLAHEMAHVIARHAAQRVEASQNVLLGSRVLQTVTGDTRAGQQALVTGAMTLASFSRQQELEADQIGIRTLGRAGYDPYGAARLLESMDRYAALRRNAFAPRGDGGENSFLSTHPSTPERLALAIAAARQIAGPDVGARDRDSLLRVVDGLTYGDDPRTGMVRGRTYLHPGFGFTFVAPDGFSLENTARAVIGVARDGRALRFDTIRVSPLTSLNEALAASATPELAIEQVEDTQINGLPAAIAVGRSPGWAFRFVLVRLGNEVYRFIFAARSLTPEIDDDFRRAAATFRRLDREETAAIRPFRIRVVTVGSGDTVETLASRMAGEEQRVESFLVLNGIDRAAALSPGTRVKVVGD
jgi:predicted Zn-dependent protease